MRARLHERWAGEPGACCAPARADSPGVRACNQAPVCAMARPMSHLARHARACENFTRVACECDALYPVRATCVIALSMS